MGNYYFLSGTQVWYIERVTADSLKSRTIFNAPSGERYHLRFLDFGNLNLAKSEFESIFRSVLHFRRSASLVTL